MAISIDFSSPPDLDPQLSWLNSPAAATPTPLGLRVVPHVGDWWSRTADRSSDDLGKRRVDEAAPLLLVSPALGAAGNDDDRGDFDLEASLAMFHRRDYDQAGVCVRASASCWLKANVERMPDGRLVLACCVTNGVVALASSCFGFFSSSLWVPRCRGHPGSLGGHQAEGAAPEGRLQRRVGSPSSPSDDDENGRRRGRQTFLHALPPLPPPRGRRRRRGRRLAARRGLRVRARGGGLRGPVSEPESRPARKRAAVLILFVFSFWFCFFSSSFHFF